MSRDVSQERARSHAGGGDREVRTRLNSGPAAGLPPLASGGPGGFASTPAEKKAAAGTIETELEPDTKKAVDHADGATSTARKGFDGCDTPQV